MKPSASGAASERSRRRPGAGAAAAAGADAGAGAAAGRCAALRDAALLMDELCDHTILVALRQAGPRARPEFWP
jgi:hypothetical protein